MILAALAVLAAPQHHNAFDSFDPAKLVISTASGVAVTDYPSLDRCEKARAVLKIGWLKEANSREHVPPGYHLDAPAPLMAVCIPG